MHLHFAVLSKTLGIMEVAKTINIFGLLLDRDLTQICYEIFCHLDSQSIVNCKLVCQSWNSFIKHHFFKLPKGKKCLLQKINSNFLNEDYKPRYFFLNCWSEYWKLEVLLWFFVHCSKLKKKLFILSLFPTTYFDQISPNIWPK